MLHCTLKRAVNEIHKTVVFIDGGDEVDKCLQLKRHWSVALVEDIDIHKQPEKEYTVNGENGGIGVRKVISIYMVCVAEPDKKDKANQFKKRDFTSLSCLVSRMAECQLHSAPSGFRNSKIPGDVDAIDNDEGIIVVRSRGFSDAPQKAAEDARIGETNAAEEAHYAKGKKITKLDSRKNQTSQQHFAYLPILRQPQVSSEAKVLTDSAERLRNLNDPYTPVGINLYCHFHSKDLVKMIGRDGYTPPDLQRVPVRPKPGSKQALLLPYVEQCFHAKTHDKIVIRAGLDTDQNLLL
ncbi:hypothetical protein AC578_9895 [Pseudocercospora eumusae]|uniref:Uncharacterized protein n=1 Tax=Pseudocercospora eumusae TaxID=321146 RepID=A0A139HB67_9PEZI|nr:hypothetical protein AC578_9895 [Pseudocercospora eumusae]